MKAEQLRKSILQLAIQGKLVPQDPADEPASVLLERIRAEKQRLIKEGKIKKDKGDSVIFKGDDNCYYEKTGSEVKNITDEIDFDLPDGWEYIRLSTVCWLGDTKKTSGETLPYLDAKTLRGKTDIAYLNEGKVVDYGTKVILVDGENSGEVFNVPFRGYMGSTFKILGACKEFNIHYLNTILDFYKDVFRDSKIGAAIPHLNKSLFKSLIIGLPPLAEQERIVAEIKKFEPLIAEYDKLEQQATKLDSEIYDKLKKSILQYAIQGKLVPQDKNDEPASVLLERIRAEKKAQLGKKYVESYIYKGDDNCYYEKVGKNEPVLLENLPFDIPDSWCWARFIDIVSFENGDRSNKYPVEENYVPFGIPFWGAKDIINNKLTPTNNLRYISQAKFDELGNGKLQNNDFVCLLRGAVGKWASFETNETITTGFINAQMVIIRPQSKSFTEWLKVYFSSPLFSQLCENFTSGTAVAQMSAKDLSKFYVPIPPYNEQIRIYNQIEIALDKLKDEN